jgi:hypothetical protein
MYYAIKKGKLNWIAFAKDEPFTRVIPDPFFHPEPGDLWFEFGRTPWEAIRNLKESLREEGKDVSEWKFLF